MILVAPLQASRVRPPSQAALNLSDLLHKSTSSLPHPNLPGELLRTSRNTDNPQDFLNLNKANPSVLIKPRPDDPNCTHHLFRCPKTGSTALYNAVMLDEHLHRFVCWMGRDLNVSATLAWHAPPAPLYPHPVLVTLKHPLDLIISNLKYSHQGASGRRDWEVSSPVQFPTPRGHHAERHSLLSNWVPIRGNKSKVNNDIFLCTDNRHICPDITEQLRHAFHEPQIKRIPLENVNHRVRDLFIINKRGEREIILPNETAVRLSAYITKHDLELWDAKCGRVCASSS